MCILADNKIRKDKGHCNINHYINYVMINIVLAPNPIHKSSEIISDTFYLIRILHIYEYKGLRN